MYTYITTNNLFLLFSNQFSLYLQFMLYMLHYIDMVLLVKETRLKFQQCRSKCLFRLHII